MLLSEFIEIYSQHPQIEKLAEWMRGTGQHATVSGLLCSAKALTVAALLQKTGRNICVVLDDEESAGYFYHDLSQLFDKERVAFFSTIYKNAHKRNTADAANEILRADTLNHLQSAEPCIVVTYPDALTEKVVPPSTFDSNRLNLAKGAAIDSETLAETLEQFGYEAVDFVYEPGQFSVRGSIVDIFSYTNELPYRIDFFGDEIESIRTFDIEKQLSIEEQTQITIIPDMQTIRGEQVTLLEFMRNDTVLCANSFRWLRERANQLYDDALVKANETTNTPTLAQHLATGDDLLAQVEQFRTIEMGKGYFGGETVDFRTAPQPIFHKNFDLVSSQLTQYTADGYAIYIASDSKKQTDRIAAIFDERGEKIAFTPILKTVHEGFIDHDMRLCCLTDHQIFDRFHKFTLRSDVARASKVAMTLKELNQFKVGDYVVHIDHGVGVFGGLQTTLVNGKPQEVIKLIYKDNDIIFVSIHALHRISKYKSKEGEEPRINKLGTGAWERLKERTKSKVKDIARDLIKLYSQRAAQKGFA